MRENSRRSTPRPARPGARAWSARETRNRTSGNAGSGPGVGRPGYGGGRPGPGNRGSAPGSSDTARLTALLEPVLHALDMDLEAVKIGSAGRRRVLRIIVDADGGVDLDDIAEVSREVSAKLDATNAMGDAPYTLEVSSPGVDRPLTQPRHWRRAIGRLVVAPLKTHASGDQNGNGAAQAEGRIVGSSERGVTLDQDGVTREYQYAELGPGRIQVEFGHFDDSAGDDDLGEED
jgi:ribosome maturation factor RimP